MTNFKSVAQARRYGKRWQKRMGLADWDITWVFKDLTDLNENGSTHFPPAGKRATITITTGDSDTPIDRVILHELAHCVTRPMVAQIEDAVEALVGTRTLSQRIIRPVQHRDEELCDALAKSLSAWA